LREYARTIPGKDQLFITAMARAFEIIPRQLCENAGFDPTNILNKLRQAHAKGEVWAGVDISSEDIANNFEKFVWEPALVKSNAITAATEAACMILSVDETIKNPESKNPVDEAPVAPRGG
ncbi:thermosome subunit, partial [Glycocaulis profundi]